MKDLCKKLIIIVLTLITAGIADSCSKINERFKELEDRIDKLSNSTIASVETQIASMKLSITDLESTESGLKDYISVLQDKTKALEKGEEELGIAIEEAKEEVKEEFDEELAATREELVKKLEAAKEQVGNDLTEIKKNIQALQDKDTELLEKIGQLQEYVDNKNNSTKEWVSATFATLDQYEGLCTSIAAIQTDIKSTNKDLSDLAGKVAEDKKELMGLIGSLEKDTADKIEAVYEAMGSLKDEITAACTKAIGEAITASEKSMKTWVNSQLDGYYTAAQMDATVEDLLKKIGNVGKEDKERADKISEELTNTKASIDTAKANIRTEYKEAVKKAITQSEGKLSQALKDSIDNVNSALSALEGRITVLEISVEELTKRVEKLEQMIQSVTIIPEFSNGSLLADSDMLYIDCIVSPSQVLSSLTKDNFKVLLNKTRTKSIDIIELGIDSDLDFSKNPGKGSVSFRVNIAEYIPENDLYSLMAAVKVKNGISDYTTEFRNVASNHDGGVQLWKDGPLWAETNIGAIDIGDYGYYFSWANTTGYIYNSENTWVEADDPSKVLTGGFTNNNYKLTNGYSLKGRIPESSDYDAARACWGGRWRLPTIEEFEKLTNPLYTHIEWVSNIGESNQSGMLIRGVQPGYTDKQIFLPASGYASTYIYNHGGIAYYWTSSYDYMGDKAGYFTFLYGEQYYEEDLFTHSTTYGSRYNGYCIRPVKGIAPIPDALPGEFSVSEGKKVRFSRGNLYYSNNAFGFENYQYTTYQNWSSSHVGLFFWSKDAGKSVVKTYNDSPVIDDILFTNEALHETRPKPGFTVNGNIGLYRCLSKDEWQYLLYERPDAYSKMKTGVTVRGKENCLVIAPDSFEGIIEDEYDMTSWPEAQSAGLVCLPLTSSYWTSSCKADIIEHGEGKDPETIISAYCIDFTQGIKESECSSRMAIRLVIDVE